MSTFRKHLTVAGIAILTLFVGSSREVRAGVVEASRPANCRNLPVITNLIGWKAQHVLSFCARNWKWRYICAACRNAIRSRWAAPGDGYGGQACSPSLLSENPIAPKTLTFTHSGW